MNLGEERAAKNEALFREVNERVEELHNRLESGSVAEFICECSDDTCTERINLHLQTYERVRQDPLLFFVKPGHEHLEIEHVVEEGDGFLVVKKDQPVAASVAEQTSPRG